MIYRIIHSLSVILLSVLLLLACNDSSTSIQDSEEQITLSPQKPVDSTFTNSIGIDFIYVEPGTFQMGVDTLTPNQRPQHSVEITKGFYLGKYEITQAQWIEIMGTNPSFDQESRLGENYLMHPVETVSWFDVQEFIDRLNEREQTNSYRLPTEAEWEFAARGGNQSRNYAYSGSNDVQEVSYAPMFAINPTSKAVGSYAPNELGFHDMTGNVWEWCSDWYSSSYYSESPGVDPKGPDTGAERVFRGSRYSFVTGRAGYFPEDKNSLSGFRLLREVD